MNDMLKNVNENGNKAISLSPKELEICLSFKNFFKKCCEIGYITLSNCSTMKLSTISLFRTNYREVEIDCSNSFSENELFDILSMYYDILCHESSHIYEHTE